MTTRKTSKAKILNLQGETESRPVRRDKRVVLKKRAEAMTLGTAALTPALYAILTEGAASLAAEGGQLWTFPAAIAAVVLFVSLPHVARGIHLITKQPLRNAWAMAIGIDAGMVCMEVMLHLAPLTRLSTALFGAGLAATLGFSVAYNVIAYRETQRS